MLGKNFLNPKKHLGVEIVLKLEYQGFITLKSNLRPSSFENLDT